MKPATMSIITVVRNGAATIASCLESVRNQSVACEHIIVDACSNDGTLELVRRLSPGARIVSEPDRGIYDAMNKGIALARGEVVGILNADDFYPDPDALARVAAAFAAPEVDSCYGDLLYLQMGPSGAASGQAPERARVVRVWKSGPFKAERFYRGWMPPHPTFFVRRSVYERLGGFNLDFGSAA